MHRHRNDTRLPIYSTEHFGTSLRQFATHSWIISVALLAIPCMAQPPGIVYSTTLPYTGVPAATGFNLYPNPTVLLVVTDASGNTYIAGAVTSGGLPTTLGAVQSQYGGGTCNLGGGYVTPCPSVFVAKFDSNGVLLFLTYLGGAISNVPSGLVVDQSGHIYVGIQAGVSWVAQLSPDGTGVGWVTFLTGGALLQLAMAPDGSLDCLTQNQAYQASTLTKLSPAGQSLAVLKLPSGTQALAVAADGSVYIGGQVFPFTVAATPGAWQTTYNGGADGFVAKMNPSLSGFAWLTFVPGIVSLMQPAPESTIWASGTTSDSTFPVLPGALQSQVPPGETSSGYLVHLSSDGTKALAATYLPAPVTSLALDGAGNVIFSAVGQGGFQATPGAQWPCPQSVPGEAFFTGNLGFFGKIDSAGQHLLWGTWAGPSVPVGPATVDANGNALAAGNLPGQGSITLAALSTVPGPIRLVQACITQAGYPNLSGPLAPGEIFSIYGAGFGPQQGVTPQPSGNSIETDLGGVQVLIEGAPAPLLYVSSAQINLVAPYLLDGRTAAHIKIVTATTTSNEVVLGVQPAAPEIFLNPAAPQGEPLAAILNQDGAVNDENHPAHIGDTVSMFVSGVGQTTPAGVDGSIPRAAGGTPLLPIQVQLNSTFANVTYAGNAPGLVSGATQVNFQIPQMPPVGAGPPYQALIVLDVGATSSGAIVSFDGNISGNDSFLWFE
jgi:uncharacterized protein (TIGR03437 family)